MDEPFKRPFKTIQTGFGPVTPSWIVEDATGKRLRKYSRELWTEAEAQWFCDTLNRAAPAGDEREAFEREAARLGLSFQRHSKDVGPFLTGDYADNRTKSAWHFWQAARSAPRLTDEERKAIALAKRTTTTEAQFIGSGSLTRQQAELLLSIIDRIAGKD